MFRRDGLELFAAAHRDEIEEAPAHDFVVLEEFVDGGEVVCGFLRDEGVDLDGEAEVGRVADRVDGPLVATGYSADGYVAFYRGAVEREAETVDSVGLEFVEYVDGEVGRGGGSDGDGEAETDGFVDDFVEVGAFERIAAGED